ncbi:DUF2911 domain-containing protein [Ekhidna sp. To15]|uniref:DUF2911 domain-containing protein n=1 Tax=Ekhidna sp. To15 TaxID=3395267 RepID=UPI003F528104
MKTLFQFRTYLRSKTINTTALPLCCLIVFSCSSDPQKRPSPLRSDSTTVHGVAAYIEFSSPAVKDRKIFGVGPDHLVPYGEMWRTGANNATYISIADNLVIDTIHLDSGSYSIFTIPNQDQWEVIFNREWEQWGSYSYKDSLDAFRLWVTPRYADQSQERMLFYFADDSLKFRWDKVRWAIPINRP